MPTNMELGASKIQTRSIPSHLVQCDGLSFAKQAFGVISASKFAATFVVGHCRHDSRKQLEFVFIVALHRQIG